MTRHVAVAIPLVLSSTPSHNAEFIVVGSRKHPGRWVFPKGGIEKTDSDAASAASREAWEEGIAVCIWEHAVFEGWPTIWHQGA
jgi:diphosphoinositol-polyphosphate diphosphatase